MEVQLPYKFKSSLPPPLGGIESSCKRRKSSWEEGKGKEERKGKGRGREEGRREGKKEEGVGKGREVGRREKGRGREIALRRFLLWR